MMQDQERQYSYRNVLQAFNPTEMALIVQLKRFFEWVNGDPGFRNSIETNTVSAENLSRLRKIGIHFDIDELSPLWEKPEVITEMMSGRGYPCLDNASGPATDELKKYPLLHLWFRYTSVYNQNYNGRNVHFRVPRNPRFDLWRLRRIASARNELGHFGSTIDHPIFAFELSDGCSVGCWFCAFSTGKLKKYFDYNENRGLFTDVVNECVALFGKEETSTALLYYGTEPHDNPGYLDFVKDYERITGSPVCTSTAVPTDRDWVRALIAYYRKGNHPWPRLSVLTKKMLYDIHDLYTPEELRDVELLLQMKDQPREKVRGGRILEESEGLRSVENGNFLESVVPQGSIACVTGFLINMVNRTIHLISPCYTSSLWPRGYRVFDEDSFTGAGDFRHVMEGIIERNMNEHPGGTSPVRFRDDLQYRKTGHGFDLISPNQVRNFTGGDLHQPLGDLVAEGTRTCDELINELMERHRRDPLSAMAVVQDLFDNGFLDEARSLRASREPAVQVD